MHDGFFELVTVRALDRGVTQFVAVGAGHDGRALRHDRPGTRWWQVGDPRRADLAGALTGDGFEPGSPALFCLDSVESQLDLPALATLLAELRSLATPGTRLALALPVEYASGPEVGGVLSGSRWRLVEISQRAQQAGLRMLAPVWAPPAAGARPSASPAAAFTERMLHRSGSEAIADHLEAEYGVPVEGTRELDLGVHRVELGDGTRWIARVFPAVRNVDAIRDDAALLAWLTAAGFPAERCARPDPVSILEGQGVLVTELAHGRALPAKPPAFELLGRLLGQLHSLATDDQPAARRPGGAWHHLLPGGSPSDELAALAELLHDARHRVPAGDADRYDALVAAVEAGDACADLPHALVHPDCVPSNAIGQPGGDVTMIDWTGAGRGPRIVSLGCLLWAAAGDRHSVAAAVSGYRESVTLEPGEVARLGAAMRLRPLVLACWAFATGRGNLRGVADRWDQQRRLIDAAAEHARATLSA